MVREVTRSRVPPDSGPEDLRLLKYSPDRQPPARVRVFVDFVMEVLQNHPDLDVSPHEFAVGAEKKGDIAATRRTPRARGGKGK